MIIHNVLLVMDYLLVVYLTVILNVKLVIFLVNVPLVKKDILNQLRLIMLMFNVKNVALNVLVVKLIKINV